MMIIVMCSNSDDNNDNNDNDDNNNRYIMHYCIPIQYIYIYDDLGPYPVSS
jgi:hypothetical protein